MNINVLLVLACAFSVMFENVALLDDVSSISGSDTEDEDIVSSVAAAQGKIFLKTTTGKVVELYRCVIGEKKVL